MNHRESTAYLFSLVIRSTKRSSSSNASIHSALQQEGPNLARPYAYTVQGSKFSQMKELRVQIAGRPFRAFYAFDPLRQAVVLCAGNKTEKGRFYAEMISLADNEFDKYLTNLATHHE